MAWVLGSPNSATVVLHCTMNVESAKYNVIGMLCLSIYPRCRETPNLCNNYIPEGPVQVRIGCTCGQKYVCI